MSNLNYWKPEITVRVTTAALIALSALCFIVVFIRFPKKREEVKFIAAVCAAGAAIYSAYYSGTTLRLNIHRDKQKRAYEILDSFNKVDLVGVRILIDQDLATADTTILAYKAITTDPQKHSNVRYLLGVLEDLAIGVRTGYVDEQVLWRSLEFTVQYYYDGLRLYIDGLRTARGNMMFYNELESIVSCWREGKSILTGKLLVRE
jgi:hypothetical protein